MKEKTYNHGDLISPFKYSKLKKVSAAYITKLKTNKKLEIEEIGGKWFVKHSKKNDRLFDNPSINSRRSRLDCPLCHKNGVDQVDCTHGE